MPKKSIPTSERFFVVNPGGSIHEVSERTFHELLAEGWRAATSEELDELAANDGNQPFVSE